MGWYSSHFLQYNRNKLCFITTGISNKILGLAITRSVLFHHLKTELMKTHLKRHHAVCSNCKGWFISLILYYFLCWMLTSLRSGYSTIIHMMKILHCQPYVNLGPCLYIFQRDFVSILSYWHLFHRQLKRCNGFLFVQAYIWKYNLQFLLEASSFHLWIDQQCTF